MKKILLTIFSVFLGTQTLFAQEIMPSDEIENNPIQNLCIESFILNGPSIVLLGEELTYSISSNDPASNIPVSYSLQIKEGEKIVQRTNDSSLQISFGELGNLLLSATINRGECSYELEKEISVYQRSILYIGNSEEAFQLGFQENLAEESTYLDQLLLDEVKFSNEEEIKSILRNATRRINNAEIILIKHPNFDQILSSYTDLITQELVYGEKTLYIISNNNPSFLNRVISLFVKELGEQQIATIKSSDFLNFMSALSLNKSNEEIDSFASFHSSQGEGKSGWLIISNLVDRAIQSGLSLQLIGTILLISLVVLFISGLRQIIGLSVFGVYQPLLFAVSIFLIGWQTTIFFFLCAILATFLTRRFSTKIHLLQSTKISLLIIIYILLLLGGIFLNQELNLSLLPSGIWNNGFIILPLLLIIMASDKLFTENFKLWSKAGWIAITEFLFVTIISRGILERNRLRNLLLSYPELLLVILIATIIVGRFSGLQLFEIVRFMPLIKKRLEDEEE